MCSLGHNINKEYIGFQHECDQREIHENIGKIVRITLVISIYMQLIDMKQL
jgi:hypothetical protein